MSGNEDKNIIYNEETMSSQDTNMTTLPSQSQSLLSPYPSQSTWNSPPRSQLLSQNTPGTGNTDFTDTSRGARPGEFPNVGDANKLGPSLLQRVQSSSVFPSSNVESTPAPAARDPLSLTAQKDPQPTSSNIKDKDDDDVARRLDMRDPTSADTEVVNPTAAMEAEETNTEVVNPTAAMEAEETGTAITAAAAAATDIPPIGDGTGAPLPAPPGTGAPGTGDGNGNEPNMPPPPAFIPPAPPRGTGDGPNNGPGSDNNFSSLNPDEKEDYINHYGEIFGKIARLYSIISTIEIYNNDPLDMILVCELVDELRLNLYNTFYPCNCGPLTDIIDTSITQPNIAQQMNMEVSGGNRNIHYKYPSDPPNDVSNEGILKYLYELDGKYHSDDEEKKAVLYKISIQEAENNHDFFGKKDSAPIIRESIKEITKTCRGYLNELKNEDDDFLKSIATRHFKDEWAFSREVFRYMKNNHFDKYSKLELYKILNVDDYPEFKMAKTNYIVKVRDDQDKPSKGSINSVGNDNQATYFIMHSGTFLPCYKENVPKINIDNSLIECIDMQPIYRRLVPMFDYNYDNNNYIFPNDNNNGENYANKQNEQEVAFVYKYDNDKINPYVLSIFHLLNPAIAMDPSTTASIDMLGFSLFRGGKHKEYLKNIQKINTFLMNSTIITNNIQLQLMMNPNILISYKFTNCLIQTLNNCFARYFSKLRIDKINIDDIVRDDSDILNGLTENINAISYTGQITREIKETIETNMKEIHKEIKRKYFIEDANTGHEVPREGYEKYFPILFCDGGGKCFYEEGGNNIYTDMKILLNNKYIEFKLNDFEISSIQQHVDKKNNDNLQKYMEEIKHETDNKYKKLFLKEEYYDNFVTLGFKSDGDGNQADILRRYYISSKPQQAQPEPVGLDKLYKTLFEHIQSYRPHIMTGDKNLISTCLMKNIPFMTNGKIGFRTENDTSKITSEDVKSMIGWSDIQEDIFRVASPDNEEDNVNVLTSILDKLCSKVKYFKDETTPVVMTNQISEMKDIKEKIKDFLGDGVTLDNYIVHVNKFIENTIVNHQSCNEYRNILQKISNNNDNDLYEIYKMLLEIKNIDLVINRLYVGLDDILKTINCEFAFLLKFLQKIQPNALNVSLGFLGKKYKNMFKKENKEDNGYYEFFEKNKTHPIGHLFFKYYINVKNILLRFFKNFYDAKNIHCLINKGSYSRLISFYIQNFDTLLKDQLDDFLDMFGENINNTSSRSRRTPVSNSSSPTNDSSQSTEYLITTELINDYKDSTKNETMYEYIKRDNKYNDILTYITNQDDNSTLNTCGKNESRELNIEEGLVKGVLNKAYGIKNKYIKGNSIEIKDAITADINDLKKEIRNFKPAEPAATATEPAARYFRIVSIDEEEIVRAAMEAETEPAEPREESESAAAEGVEMGSQGSDIGEASGKVLIGSKSNNPYYVLQDLDVDDLFESNVNIKYDMSVDTDNINVDNSDYLTISDDEGDGDTEEEENMEVEQQIDNNSLKRKNPYDLRSRKKPKKPKKLPNNGGKKTIKKYNRNNSRRRR